ncbi:methyltransferase [candidate division KSB1 bacterium]|nr:methyltransferase [candidate division KSB1 bacterium]NIR69277.1 methyltransferase [candidate division KSB1 bacterium]NIS24138.1 methyltransferase [candidate division KSB1 bacterium]NIT71052.1 methyltransferase [candidate division KSB1 bacterium]NIU24757.1 methyltransferase [candidate division KSB1 bacterium]
MNPKLFRTGEFLAQTLQSGQIQIPVGSKVLDMGTGSGVAAIFAAQWADKVVAVDLNPAAVRCAKINTLLNHFEDKIEVRNGDLFDPVPNEKFDLILFNPPYLKGRPRNYFERALFGEEVIEFFAEQVGRYLRPEGEVFLVLSSQADLSRIQKSFAEHGFKLATVSRRDYFNESLYLYRLTCQIHAPTKATHL